MEIWFWQLIISPHMAGLASALSQQGHSVTFVAEREMSAERGQQGWTLPDLGASRLILTPNKETALKVAVSSPPHSIHICQGIRANGVIGSAQKALRKLKRNQFVIMETVDDSGPSGWIKKILYWWLFKRWSGYLTGVLAIGNATRGWLIARGVPQDMVFPFAYFLPSGDRDTLAATRPCDAKYKVLFVGQFIELKRLDLLIEAIAKIDRPAVELVVVGSGPLEKDYRMMAENALSAQVEWIGRLPIADVRNQMARADCLVLPSRYDGWGAVVSEALMSGTPAVCSDTCGSATAVRASGYGGVFQSGNIDALCSVLEECISRGKLTASESRDLADWALCLGEAEGAKYLTKIISASYPVDSPPLPPWNKSFVP